MHIFDNNISLVSDEMQERACSWLLYLTMVTTTTTSTTTTIATTTHICYGTGWGHPSQILNILWPDMHFQIERVVDYFAFARATYSYYHKIDMSVLIKVIFSDAPFDNRHQADLELANISMAPRIASCCILL